MFIMEKGGPVLVEIPDHAPLRSGRALEDACAELTEGYIPLIVADDRYIERNGWFHRLDPERKVCGCGRCGR